MIFTEIVGKGIDRIYAEDLESQKHQMRTALEVTRKNSSIRAMLENKCFFVPNEDYLLHYFGPAAKDPYLDIYNRAGFCNWTNFLVMPIRDLSEEIVGFVGYDVLLKVQTEDGIKFDVDKGKYRYSSSYIFNRSHFIFTLPGVYKRALRDGYIILTDGNFDMTSIWEEGYNSGSMLGSHVSDEIIFLLSFIPLIFVAEDIDGAGRKLYEELAAKLPNVQFLRQNVAWDSDDALKVEWFKEEYLKMIDFSIRYKVPGVRKYKPWEGKAYAM
jgi:hypothetical protein